MYISNTITNISAPITGNVTTKELNVSGDGLGGGVAGILKKLIRGY